MNSGVVRRIAGQPKERNNVTPMRVTEHVAYLRTSSCANVDEDKDSDKRQLAAIEAYAKAAGFEIVAMFYDAAVSGADPVADRPGSAVERRPAARER
jgi:Resolvase, N terminal domain